MVVAIVSMKLCVRSEENNKVVPEIHFVALLQLKART